MRSTTCPNLSPLGQRLARRCWPGPVTLVVADHHPESLMQQLPPAVQQAVAPDGTIGLRVPAHQAILDVLRLLAGPIVLTSANRSGQAGRGHGPRGRRVALGTRYSLVLDDGQSPLRPAIERGAHVDDRFEVLRQGVVSEQTLKRLASMMILFVCTGNTCRSPMAEGCCRKHDGRAAGLPSPRAGGSGRGGACRPACRR